MTQYMPPPAPAQYAAMGEPPKTSVLAILSLVFSLLICGFVVAPGIGFVLGVIALVTISRSGGRQKGKGLAIAGVVISVLVMIGHIGSYAAVKISLAVIASPAERFLDHVDAREFDEAILCLSADAGEGVSTADLAGLRDHLSADWGEFQGVSVDFFGRAYQYGALPMTSWSPQQAMIAGQPAAGVPIMMPVEFEFSRGSVYGIIQVMMPLNTPPGAVPQLELDSMTFADDSGIWTFPPEHEDDNDDPAAGEDEAGATNDAADGESDEAAP